MESLASNKNKLRIRPQIPQLKVNDSMTSDEQFQNQSLRPILKLQNDLLKLLVADFIKMKKNVFYELKSDQRSQYIRTTLLGDRMIIHQLRGIIIGLFTTEETAYYLQNKSTINKRIQSLLNQRISSFL